MYFKIFVYVFRDFYMEKQPKFPCYAIQVLMHAIGYIANY